MGHFFSQQIFFRGLGLVLYRKTDHKKPNPTKFSANTLLITATTECCRSDLTTKSRGHRKCVPVVGKRLRTVQRERDDSAIITRLATDSITARGSRKRLGKNRPSRPPIVVRETRQQLRRFCSVYFTGVTNLRRGAALITGESTRGVQL